MLVRRPCCTVQTFHRGTDRLNKDGAQPSISKPKTLGTRLLSFPDKWMGREHLQGMTIRGGGHFTYKNKANRTATSAW